MKPLKRLSLLLLCSLLAVSPMASANYSCSGAVRGVAIEQSGDVLVENIGSISWARLCSVRINSNAIAPEACKIMYASLLTAQATGKSVTFWVNDPATTCATLTPWLFVNGLYFFRVDS